MNVSWFADSACRQPGIDSELFFPVGEAGPASRQIAEAKAICARCPVAAQCRDWALRTGEPDGIWGGMTPEERRKARHARTVGVPRLAGEFPGSGQVTLARRAVS